MAYCAIVSATVQRANKFISSKLDKNKIWHPGYKDRKKSSRVIFPMFQEQNCKSKTALEVFDQTASTCKDLSHPEI